MNFRKIEPNSKIKTNHEKYIYYTILIGITFIAAEFYFIMLN